MAIYTSDGFSPRARCAFWVASVTLAVTALVAIAPPITKALQYGITINSATTFVAPQVYVQEKTGLVTRAVNQDGSLLFTTEDYTFQDIPYLIWPNEPHAVYELEKFSTVIPVRGEAVIPTYTITFDPSIEAAIDYYNHILVPKYGKNLLESSSLMNVVYQDVAPQMNETILKEPIKLFKAQPTGHVTTDRDEKITAAWRAGIPASDLLNERPGYEARYVFACEHYDLQDNREEVMSQIVEETGNPLIAQLIRLNGTTVASMSVYEPCRIAFYKGEPSIGLPSE